MCGVCVCVCVREREKKKLCESVNSRFLSKNTKLDFTLIQLGVFERDQNFYKKHLSPCYFLSFAAPFYLLGLIWVISHSSGKRGGTLVCHLLQDLMVPGSNLDKD